MPTRTRERICVSWHLNFVAEINNGVVERSFFSRYEVEPVIHSDNTEKLMRELEKYFKGKKVDFRHVPVKYPTHFCERVLEIVREIPFGKTATYSEVAVKAGTSPRAVGVALKMNPVPVIVPCHRVVSKGGIGGYSEGVEIKKRLLELEGAGVY